MPPFGPNDEAIALAIETQAKLDGIRQARAEIRGTAQDMALAARTSQAAGTQLVATPEQVRQAWAKAGTDFERFKVELLAIVTAAQQTGQATQQAGAAAQASAAKLGVAGERGEVAQRELAAAVTQTTKTIETQGAAAEASGARAAAAARRSAEAQGAAAQAAGAKVDALSPKLRTAANAASTLSFAVSAGGGSLQSLAITAGTATSSLATLAASARVAAAASGIGAVVVVLGTVIGLVTQFRARTREAKEEWERMRSEIRETADLARAQKELRAVTERVTELKQEVASLDESFWQRAAGAMEQGFAGPAGRVIGSLLRGMREIRDVEGDLRDATGRQQDLARDTAELARAESLRAALAERATEREQLRQEILRSQAEVADARRQGETAVVGVLGQQLAADRARLAANEQETIQLTAHLNAYQRLTTGIEQNAAAQLAAEAKEFAALQRRAQGEQKVADLRAQTARDEEATRKREQLRDEKRARDARLLDRATDLDRALVGENQLLDLRLRGATALQLQLAEIRAQADQRREQIAQLFTLRDREGGIVRLTEEQVRFRDRLLAQLERSVELKTREAAVESEARRRAAETREGLDSDNVRERARAQLAELERRRREELEAARPGVESDDEQVRLDALERIASAEARYERDKQRLRKETMRQMLADAKTLTGVLLESGSKEVRAVGKVMEAIRRLKIGALAAEAAVQSAKEFALVPASLAVGDALGATLHAAAGTQLAAAAALGFQEALGGGSRGGGAGSSGGGSNTTFEPRDREQAGAQVVNLYTVDPFSGEVLRVVSYDLQRAGVLKRPIVLPPTTGLITGAA